MTQKFKGTRRFSVRAGREDYSGISPAGNPFTGSRQLYKLISAGVELEVDIDGLIEHLGRRAANNKGGKAALQGGLIKARIISAEVIDEDYKR